MFLDCNAEKFVHLLVPRLKFKNVLKHLFSISSNVKEMVEGKKRTYAAIIKRNELLLLISNNNRTLLHFIKNDS